MNNQEELIPYIKISRSLFRHFLWKEKRVYTKFEAWLDLIQRASFTDMTEIIAGRVINRQRGQVSGSLRYFADGWGWSTKKVLTFFSQLRNENMISSHLDNGITTIFLVNFEKHNSNAYKKETQKKHLKNYNPIVTEEYGNSKGVTEEISGKQSGNAEETNIIKDNKVNKENILSASFEAANLKISQDRKDYNELLTHLEGKSNIECWQAIKKFIDERQPEFIDPFIHCWNIFALNYKLIKGAIRITKARSEKLKIRLSESGFRFFEILDKIKKSDFLLGRTDRGSWKVDFDFIIHSEMNYVKILEEKY